jgi:uncharacterized protein (TIGR02453 family)
MPLETFSFSIQGLLTQYSRSARSPSLKGMAVKNTVDLAPVFRFSDSLEEQQQGMVRGARSDYENALERFEDFVAALIIEISAFDDLAGVAPKDCIFRIYRDVRFSKDKSPYKTNMGASIGPGGRKSMGYPYYLHVEPGNHSMLAGGCHEASTEQLKVWARWTRTPPPSSSSAERTLLPPLAAFWKAGQEPQGYPADHPELELLRLKQITVMHTVTDKELLAPSVVQSSVAIFKTMKPFLDYLGSILPGLARP